MTKQGETGAVPAVAAAADTGAPARSSVLRLAAPLVLSFWMRSLFSLVDTVYASSLGDAAVAAVGLAVPLEFLMIACWVGLSTGLTSTLSRAIGANANEKMLQLMASGRRMVLAMVPFFVLLGLGVLAHAPHMGLEPDLERMFALYTSVLVIGSAFTSFWSILPDSVVKAHHDTRSTMWAGIWSNLINVTLNTLFLFVFHWGIFGIAFSTVLGRLGGLIYAQRRATALEAARRAGQENPNREREVSPMRSILILAIPAAVTYGLMAMESSLINLLLARLENATEAIAAYAIYFRVMLFAIMPIMAVSVAMLPFVARRFGESDLDGIRRGFREASLVALGYCVLVVTPALALLAPTIARSLSESRITTDYTIMALWACPLACLVTVPFFLVRPVFEGMQRGAPGLVMAVLRYLVLTAPLALAGAWVASRMGQPEFLGVLGGLIVATLITSVVFLFWIRQALRVVESAPA